MQSALSDCDSVPSSCLALESGSLIEKNVRRRGRTVDHCFEKNGV